MKVTTNEELQPLFHRGIAYAVGQALLLKSVRVSGKRADHLMPFNAPFIKPSIKRRTL